ncbi:MAG: ATP phosphoribosyltransferase [Spirochaetaceae bacterium]|nr:ATP phosphoribosyltransferase [Spirochaetaceae bacterium]
MDKLRLLIPKGRIYDGVIKLLSEAGWTVKGGERSYRPSINASYIDVKIMKPQNVGELLQLGSHDAGWTGTDWLDETGADVERLLDLELDPVRIVAAIPESLDEKALKSKTVVVATEYVNIAESWLKGQGYRYKILRTHGATEVFPPDDADMIIDNCSSGQTLLDNHLKIIATVCSSSTHFVASKAAMQDKDKRKKIEEIAMLLKAVLDGRGAVMLEMNVSKENLEALCAILPAMKSPTICSLSGGEGYAVKIAVRKAEVAALLPLLKEKGASDIVEYELRKLIV